MNHILIVKGSASVATDACVTHGANITSIEYRIAYDDCLITVPDTVPVETLLLWYVEAPVPGVTGGALVWYAPNGVLPSSVAAKNGVPTP